MVNIYEQFRDKEAHGRGATAGIRTAAMVRGVTLHQTACRLPYGGSAVFKVPCDFVVHQGGEITQVRPLSEYVWHAQGLSKITFGVEIEAREPGLIGESGTFWRSTKERVMLKKMSELAMPLTEAQRQSAIDLLGYLHNYCRNIRAGERPKVYGHRQSHSSRTSDPGENIWRSVAEKVIADGLYDCAYGYTYGSGNSIPDQWSGRSLGYTYR